jgi:hypothetical protein
MLSMKSDNDQKPEPGSAPHLVEMIEAVDRRFHDYLLRQHLSLWHPISTAPNNHDLELIVLDGASSVVLPFPCQRTNTGEWINTDLETGIHVQPTKWRPWQKAKAPKPTLGNGSGFPHTKQNERRWSDT